MASSSTWALNQISRILPLDEDSLNQLLDFSASLAPEAAAEHLKGILGDSSAALEFISSFNARRTPTQRVAAATTLSSHPNSTVQGKKKKNKTPLKNLPPPRRPDDYGNTEGAYHKKNEEDYMPSTSRSSNHARPNNAFSLTSSNSQHHPPSTDAFGPSLPNVHTRTASPAKSSHTSSLDPLKNSSTPTPIRSTATSKKLAVPSGTPMRSATQDLSDLDSALRTLEMSLNPTLSVAPAATRRCSCMGLTHPLLAAAPNCLSCGKIICTKEGLAPCTFCGTPLLTASQIQDMARALKDERGRERMAANNAKIKQQQYGRGSGLALGFDLAANEALEKAQAHRDRLLGFQASNAQRTRVVDEAAAFETPDAGVMQWGSATQRAAQLKRQQKILREMEWAARPEYEKRRMVVSVDLVDGKVVKRMGAVERPEEREEDESGAERVEGDEAAKQKGTEDEQSDGIRRGVFARNPLLGKLVRPIWRPANSGNGSIRTNEEVGKGKVSEDRPQVGRTAWRRVQDDIDDNEEYILNGGVFGAQDQEPASPE